MTLLAIDKFNGMAPLIRPKKLAEGMATVALNTRFDTGSLTPWKNSFSHATLSNVKSIYLYRGNWIYSPYSRDYVGTLLPNDRHERIYFTDNGYPKFRSGTSEYKLGLPRPGAPSVAVVNEGDKTNITDVRNQRYVVTLVDNFGHEGPSSLPTAAVEVGKGAEVNINLGPSVVSGNYALGGNAKYRIYRTNRGSETGTMQYVDEVPYGTGQYTDSKSPGELQELLPSENWVAAPDSDANLYPGGPLASLIETPGGVLAGHSGNTVFLSEPNVPTAWPYYYAFEDEVVGLAVIQGGILVCTKGRPWLLTGSTPDYMVPVPIEEDAPCVSKESIVDMGEYAIYATPRGLALAQGNSVTLITSQILDEDSWAQYQPDTIRAFNYHGKYVASYGVVTSLRGFVFDPVGEMNSFIELNQFGALSGYVEPGTGELYLVEYKSGSYRLTSFNRSTPWHFAWRSKEYEFPDPINFSWARIIGEGPTVLRLYADGQFRTLINVPDEKPFPLPKGFKAGYWQFEFEGQGVVDGAYFATSMQELPR